MHPPHLFAMRPADVVAHLHGLGHPCEADDARRLVAHVLGDAQDAIRAGLPVRRSVRDALAATTSDARLTVVERVVDEADGFVKYLFGHADGALSEAVRIPLHRPGRYTVCLSTQVGCAMGCVFCATGQLGLRRNLEAWEIVAAWRAIHADLRREQPGSRVSGAVFMGQGEPLMNLAQVVQAASVLNDPCAGRMAAENITISTVGPPGPLARFVDAGLPYRLIFSLHSAVPERRAALVPVVGRVPVTDLLPLLRRHQVASGDRLTLAWTLIGGVNHGPDEVEALVRTFEGLPIRVNLIDLNRWDERDGRRRATDEERSTFVDALHAAGIATQRRYSGGQNRHAACGMLASRRMATPGDATSAQGVQAS